MKYGHTHKLSRVWRISSKETSWQNIFVQVVTDNKIIISFARESNINDNADGHSDDYGDYSEDDVDGDGRYEKDRRG